MHFVRSGVHNILVFFLRGFTPLCCSQYKEPIIFRQIQAQYHIISYVIGEVSLKPPSL